MIATTSLGWSSIFRVRDLSSYCSARRRSGVILAVLLGLIGFSYFLVAGIFSGEGFGVTTSRLIALALLAALAFYMFRRASPTPGVLYVLSSVVSFATIFMVVVVVSHRPEGLSAAWLELSAPLFMALCLHYFALRLEPLLALLIGGGLSVVMMIQVGYMAEPGGSALHAIFYVIALNLFGFAWLAVNKRHDRAVFEDVRRLRDSNSLKRNVIFAIEHELRQPLVALRTLVNSSKSQGSAEDLHGRLSIIADAVRMVDNTLEYLHIWGRAIDGQGEIPISHVLIKDIIDDVAELTRLEAALRGVELEFSPAPIDLLVCSNASALRQILVNLVINAIRHSPCVNACGARVRVVVRSNRRGCSIFVADNGVGIPTVSRKEIWLPFKRFDKGGGISKDSHWAADGGKGLGLYLVESTIRNLAGHLVGFRSIVGRGTVFRVRIPWAPQVDDGAASVSGNSPRPDRGGLSKPCPAVRVVFETDKEAALRAQDVLSREGFGVLVSKQSELTGMPDRQAGVNQIPVICVDQESLSVLLSRRSSQEGTAEPSSMIVFIGTRSRDFPSNGIVVLPDNEQGYLVLPRLIGHALNTHQQ